MALQKMYGGQVHHKLAHGPHLACRPQVANIWLSGKHLLGTMENKEALSKMQGGQVHFNLAHGPHLACWPQVANIWLSGKHVLMENKVVYSKFEETLFTLQNITAMKSITGGTIYIT